MSSRRVIPSAVALLGSRTHLTSRLFVVRSSPRGMATPKWNEIPWPKVPDNWPQVLRDRVAVRSCLVRGMHLRVQALKRSMRSVGRYGDPGIVFGTRLAVWLEC